MTGQYRGGPRDGEPVPPGLYLCMDVARGWVDADGEPVIRPVHREGYYAREGADLVWRVADP